MTHAPWPATVLFACNLNTVRSPLAAVLLRRRLGPAVFVDSCGLQAGGEVDGFAVAVAGEVGLDLSDHRPKSFDQLEDGGFDLVVSLTATAHDYAATFTRGHAVELEFWPLADPAVEDGSREQRLEGYRALRRTLDRRIRTRFPACGLEAP